MKRLLVLFTSGFPYGINEPFLENEYPLYKEYFDKVLIVAACEKGAKPTRRLDDPNIEVIRDHTLSHDVRSVLEALPWVLTDRMFYKELFRVFSRKKCILRRLYEMVSASICGNHRAMQAYRWIRKHGGFDSVMLYSTWMFVPAYAAVRLKHKCKMLPFTVSRAHSFDVYLERTNTGYRPFHEQLYHELDEVAIISAFGKKYLTELYSSLDKISVHRLGALDRGIHNPCAGRETLRIVSCARTVALKRLDRIVDALCQITDHPIHWTHLGGGEVQAALERYAAEKLPSNVTVTFSGTIPNTQVYQIYESQPFHVFVNVSETEGVPVSVMEAMSFDIPVIATAVGGTPELIDQGKNGFLLDADYPDTDLIRLLYHMAQMPEEEYLGFRHAARQKFQQDFNAYENNRKFIEYAVNKQQAYQQNQT